jgi:hypothetical protein
LTRTIRVFAAVVFLLFACSTIASAQIGSAYFAGGTATDSSVGPINTLGAGPIYPTPRLGGFFETYGGDVIFFHHLGIGAEMTSRKDNGAYAGLAYHSKFYDVNAVYRPWTFAHRLAPEFQAGYGKSTLNLYYTQQICYTLPEGCPGINAEVASVSNPQFHFAAGFRFYAYKGLFVRPQVDVRRVQGNFTTYFGSPWVYQTSVAVGYTLRLNREKTAKK